MKKARGGELALGGAGGTLVGCRSAQYEDDYAGMLTRADAYRVEGLRLVLRDAGGRTLLEFGRYSPVVERALADAEWELVSLRGGDPPEGSPMTLRFASGHIAGSAGCNGYVLALERADRGRFVVSDREEALTTVGDCMRRATDRQEEYLRALGESRAYRLEGGRLELLDGSGETVLAFRAR